MKTDIEAENDSSKLIQNQNGKNYDALSSDTEHPPAQDDPIYQTRNTNVDPHPHPLWFSKRLFISVILFMGCVDYQLLRNNINITVVEMTSNKTYVQGNVTLTQAAEFNWDTATIGFIMSIGSYGGFFSVFGGLLSDGIGGARTCGLSMMAAGTATMLLPAALYLDFYLFMGLRFFIGLFETLYYVCIADVCSRWFPKRERSMLISFSFNGSNAGAAVVYPFCGYVAHKFGWRMVFYSTGVMSIIISSMALIFMKNKPTQDKLISKEELYYILEETDQDTGQKVAHPFKKIFTSIPIWNLCVVLFVFIWLSTLLESYLPLYVKDMTHAETDQIGIISSIPNCAYLIMFPVAGYLMDYWKNNSNTTTTRIHKTITVTAYLGASALFVIVAIVSNFYVSMILFVCIQILTSAVPLIIEILNINLAPDHCSVISALTSFFFSVGAVIAQTTTGFMITQHDLQGWNNCFILAAIISTLGATIFGIYGSSETQPWSSATMKEEYILL